MPSIALNQIPLFASLPDEEIRHLSQSLRMFEHPAGSLIFREGEPADRFSIIIEGQIEIIKAFDTPEVYTLAVLGPGEYLGEVSLLFPDRRRSATARAGTHVRTLEMTQEDFEGLINRHSSLAVMLVRQMSQRIRNSESLTIQDLQEKNQQLARALAELQLAQAQLVDKEILERELSIAKEIQKNSLPKDLPVLSGWELDVYWQPARAVGGDFYDFVHIAENQLMLVIGDVTGKGVPAALVMATTQTLLRSVTQYHLKEHVPSAGEILTRVNGLSCQTIPPNMFITCLIAQVDLKSGQVRLANAGHNLPYLCRAEGAAELRAVGMPLGLMPGMRYEEIEAHLECGDSLLLYSDGLVEAHNHLNEMYGTRRLQSHLSRRQPGSDLIEHVLADLAGFTGTEWEQEDDLTCLGLTRLV